ncbi:hypothetical protein FOL47_003302 [Perkinsus chesapeaki]|uniref:Methyltransferase domain-containing protein n=1 Tax=Perkinsus chesapeaki TaxID=330153 RepID=A0A7J6N0F4_PERCH|nr:hypothetical protein FOL47_003302 [Perkinsus chesapeaki]
MSIPPAVARQLESILRLDGEQSYSEGWKRLLSLEKMPEARIEPVRVLLAQVRDRLRRSSVDEWHIRMLNDGGRNRAYRAAIVKAMRDRGDKIDHVIDIGCGTGILSCYIAEAAPARVRITACDCSWALCSVARRACGPRVNVIQSDSSELALARPADMVVAELMDCALLGERFMEVVRDLRNRGQLAENAVVIPRSGRVYGAIIESELISERGYYFTEGVALEGGYASIHQGFKYRKLTDDFEVCRADFMTGRIEGLGRKEVTVKEGGTCACVLVWWEADLYVDVSITSVGQCDWDYAVYPCRPGKVESGERIVVDVSCEDSLLSVLVDGSYVEGVTTASEVDMMVASSVRRDGLAGVGTGDLPHEGCVIDLTGLGHSVVPCLLAGGYVGTFLSWMPEEGDGLWSILRDQLEHFRISPLDFAKRGRMVEANSGLELADELGRNGFRQRGDVAGIVCQLTTPWGSINGDALKFVSALGSELWPAAIVRCQGYFTRSSLVRRASAIVEESVPEGIREEARRGEILRADRLLDFPLEDLEESSDTFPIFNIDFQSGELTMDVGSIREEDSIVFGRMQVRIPAEATGLVLVYVPAAFPTTGRCVIPWQGEGNTLGEVKVAWSRTLARAGLLATPWVELVGVFEGPS